MATKGKRHIHKYYQANVGYQKVWACALPDCNHHMPPHYKELVNGKASICWKCGEEMLLDSIAMKMEKPECIDCRPTKDITEYLIDKGVINPITGQ